MISDQVKEKDLQTSLLNKHLDQARQLQLIAEQRLTETKDLLIEYQEQENQPKKDVEVDCLNKQTHYCISI
ncbi:hypothetical protein FE410_07770 [Leuconostoc carnosum]|uniref:hypothetical protein n=1 Tax=Leuconostoc carnosum TaxID=1252 RepID=UPI001238484E|nr:hypothetical protein FE414_08010 [Leuconostoc carnosum]KAA8380447.1 hypothetical protein FE410_07770 [Leuconostoc carnosum]